MFHIGPDEGRYDYGGALQALHNPLETRSPIVAPVPPSRGLVDTRLVRCVPASLMVDLMQVDKDILMHCPPQIICDKSLSSSSEHDPASYRLVKS